MVSNAAKTQRYACGGTSLGPCHLEVPGGLGLGSFSDVMDVEGPRGLEVQGWEQGPELGLGLRPTAVASSSVIGVVPFACARYLACPRLCCLLLCSFCFRPSTDFQVQVQLFPKL